MAYRKLSDAEIIKTWEECGNIRETSRRLKATYNAVYMRGYERLGALMVRDGRVLPIPMRLGPDGRWEGTL